jgi:hypothetical protein
MPLVCLTPRPSTNGNITQPHTRMSHVVGMEIKRRADDGQEGGGIGAKFDG